MILIKRLEATVTITPSPINAIVNHLLFDKGTSHLSLTSSIIIAYSAI